MLVILFIIWKKSRLDPSERVSCSGIATGHVHEDGVQTKMAVACCDCGKHLLLEICVQD